MYLNYDLLSSTSSYLSDNFVDVQFEFGKFMSGQKEIKPRWERAVSVVNSHLGELLGKLYVKYYFSNKAKEMMEDMVNRLNKTLKEKINNLTWMSEDTKKKKALLKNEVFKAKIGYPNKWNDFSKINLDKDNILDMVFECNLFDFEDEMKYLFKPPNQDKWEMNAHSVNAYFHPLRNEIVFPAGILQKPFFDENQSDAENYGGIGVIIGHEMTHSYDDKGSKFDHEGNLNNWWNETDLEKFTEKGKYYIDQFDQCSYNGKKLNGELTLGENLADHGGLKILHAALNNNI